MTLSDQVRSALEVAGYTAGETFPKLAEGGVPLTLFTLEENNTVTALAVSGPGEVGTNQERRNVLHAHSRPGQLRFLIYAGKGKLSDSRCQSAMFVEFGRYPAELSGLMLALPYARQAGGKGLFAGMVQAPIGPKDARHMVDSWLPAFIRTLSGAGKGAWLRAAEYDRAVQPSQERFEADSRPLPVLCNTLDTADAGPDSNDAVNGYLDALIERYPFRDGIAFRRALAQLELDFTVESLLRVDHLLGRLAATLGETPQQFLRHRAHLNFLHAVAAYCGKTVAKAAQSRLDWYSEDQYRRRFSRAGATVQGAGASLVGIFNEGEPDGSRAFLPVQAVIERMFGVTGSAQFRAQLTEWGRIAQACRPRQINDDMPAVQRKIDEMPAGARRNLKTPYPSWATRDRFDLWFRSYLSLFEGGRLVWGYIVQANGRLFSAGDTNCPGEVVYDPQGILTPPHLAPVAKRIGSYKCGRMFDPRLSYYADYLTSEITRSFALKVPYKISSDDLCTSTLMFIRSHLPGKMLVGSCIPLLVKDDLPGIVTVLPYQFWTPAIVRQCAEFGWPT